VPSTLEVIFSSTFNLEAPRTTHMPQPTSLDEALLLFDRWKQDRTILQALLRSSGKQLVTNFQVTTVVKFSENSLVLSHEGGGIRVTLEGAQFEYAEPREFAAEVSDELHLELQEESERDVAGYLKITLSDDTTLTVFEPTSNKTTGTDRR